MCAAKYLHLAPGSALPRLECDSPFKAIVVIDAEVTDDWQNTVSNWLVQSGCRYMLAWGKKCCEWDTSVDLANLRAFGFGEIPDDEFVMTTWHAEEPLQEVFWFAGHAAEHPSLALECIYIIHVALNERLAEMLKLFQDAQGD